MKAVILDHKLDQLDLELEMFTRKWKLAENVLTIGTDLEKISITSLAQQWILCSEWVPSEWESKHLIKTSQ